jgi:hypothetical protein
VVRENMLKKIHVSSAGVPAASRLCGYVGNSGSVTKGSELAQTELSIYPQSKFVLKYYGQITILRNIETILMTEDTMAQIMIKDVAKSLIDKMPDNATWDDLMYEIYVRQAIESGLEDSKAGRTKDVSDIRKKYGLPA